MKPLCVSTRHDDYKNFMNLCKNGSLRSILPYVHILSKNDINHGLSSALLGNNTYVSILFYLLGGKPFEYVIMDVFSEGDIKTILHALRYIEGTTENYNTALVGASRCSGPERMKVINLCIKLGANNFTEVLKDYADTHIADDYLVNLMVNKGADMVDVFIWAFRSYSYALAVNMFTKLFVKLSNVSPNTRTEILTDILIKAKMPTLAETYSRKKRYGMFGQINQTVINKNHQIDEWWVIVVIRCPFYHLFMCLCSSGYTDTNRTKTSPLKKLPTELLRLTKSFIR